MLTAVPWIPSFLVYNPLLFISAHFILPFRPLNRSLGRSSMPIVLYVNPNNHCSCRALVGSAILLAESYI